MAILALDAWAAKYAGEFLEIGLGGRACSMGGAFCALADDGSGFYWNPAGYSRNDKIQFSGMFAPLYGGLGSNLANYHHIGFSMPFTGAVVGVNWIRLSVPDIPLFPNLDGLSYNTRRDSIQAMGGYPAGYFSDSEDAFFFTFAKMNRFNLDLGWSYFEVPIEVPIGMNFKMIRQSLHNSEAFGLGLDAGMQIRFDLDHLAGSAGLGDVCFALNYQDFTKTGIDWGGKNSDAIPANIKTGIAYLHHIEKYNCGLNFSYDTDRRWGNESRWGAEFVYHNLMSFRMGQEWRGWTFGAGGRYRQFALDYGFINTDLGVVNRLSFQYYIK
ncbi:hypothetical protein ISS30_06425 [bacterium]|nr:hypothetical protein [bacterium]